MSTTHELIMWVYGTFTVGALFFTIISIYLAVDYLMECRWVRGDWSKKDV